MISATMSSIFVRYYLVGDPHPKVFREQQFAVMLKAAFLHS